MTDRDVGAALRIQQAIDKYAVKHGCAPARLLVGSAVWDEAMTEMKYHPSLVKEATFAGIPIVNWGGYIHKDWIVIEPTTESSCNRTWLLGDIDGLARGVVEDEGGQP